MPNSGHTSEDLTGRVAIVTGGSRGIGRAIARRPAGAGAGVVDATRTARDAEQVVEEITADGGTAIAISCDVAVASEVEQMVAATLDRFGRINVVVNNAGISPIHLVEVRHPRARGRPWLRRDRMHAGVRVCAAAFDGSLPRSDDTSEAAEEIRGAVRSVGAVVGRTTLARFGTPRRPRRLSAFLPRIAQAV